MNVPVLEWQPVVMQFVRPADLATIVLNDDTNDRDLFAVCECAWPCPRVVLSTPDHSSYATP